MSQPLRQTLRLLCLQLIFFIFSAAVAESAAFSILQPKDKSLISGRFLAVSLKILDPEIDTITVSTGKRGGNHVITVPKGRDMICRTITAGFHLNELSVSASKSGRTIETKKMNLRYMSDLSRAEKPSDEFSRQPFHVREKEDACSKCHRLKITETDFSPPSPKESVCYPCHKKITENKNVHGPSATWDCLLCHEKDTAPNRFAIKNVESDLCFTCHSGEKIQWAEKKYVHGPTATGKCSICHDPHSSASRYSIKYPVNQLCLSCHENVINGNGRHTFKVFAAVRNEHPVRDVRDPKNPGKKLTCASCHNPHTSMTPTMLASDGGSIYQFCNRCHMN